MKSRFILLIVIVMLPSSVLAQRKPPKRDDGSVNFTKEQYKALENLTRPDPRRPRVSYLVRDGQV